MPNSALEPRCQNAILRALSIWLNAPRRFAFAVVPVVLALGASRCGGSPATPSPAPGGDTSAADLAFCIDETNRYRAQAGSAALTRDAALESYAAEAAKSDGVSGVPHAYFGAHPSGGGENEVIDWHTEIYGSVRGVMQAAIAGYWSEGPNGGHYRNLTGGYARLGCGVYVNGTRVTFVQEFR